MSGRIMLRIFSLLMVCILHTSITLCLEVNLTSQAVSCNGGNDGEISVSIMNAATDITIRLTQAKNNKLLQQISINADTTITFSKLSAIEYRVLVLIPGKPFEKIIWVKEPEPLKANTIEVIQVPADGENCNGIIMATPSGGSPPYRYNWSENAGNAETAKIEGLCPGIYRCIINDSFNCGSVSATSALFNYDSNN